MSKQHEAWRDEVDLERLSADRRSIAAGWLVVFGMIALGTVGPAIVHLVEPGHAAATQSVTRTGNRPGTLSITHICGVYS